MKILWPGKLSIYLEAAATTLSNYIQVKDTLANAAVLASDVYDGFERREENV